MPFKIMTTHIRAGEHAIFDGVAISTMSNESEALRHARKFAKDGECPDILVFDTEANIGILVKGNKDVFAETLGKLYHPDEAMIMDDTPPPSGE